MFMLFGDLRMKTLAFLLSLILIFALTGCVEQGFTLLNDLSVTVVTSADCEPYSRKGDFSSDEEEETPVNPDDAWQMALVNPWTPLPDNFTVRLANIDTRYAGYDSAQFDARAIDQLHAMCAAAEQAGVRLVVISAYRTNATQTKLFNNKVNRVKSANPNLSDEEAIAEASTVVAKPSTSEHELGLAVDFNSVEDSFRDTKAYTWLQKHCNDYGFILRYADDKQDKTGIIPEPWHYRYVGVENAKKITASKLCLEEYLEANQ